MDDITPDIIHTRSQVKHSAFPVRSCAADGPGPSAIKTDARMSLPCSVAVSTVATTAAVAIASRPSVASSTAPVTTTSAFSVANSRPPIVLELLVSIVGRRRRWRRHWACTPSAAHHLRHKSRLIQGPGVRRWERWRGWEGALVGALVTYRGRRRRRRQRRNGEVSQSLMRHRRDVARSSRRLLRRAAVPVTGESRVRSGEVFLFRATGRARPAASGPATTLRVLPF